MKTRRFFQAIPFVLPLALAAALASTGASAQGPVVGPAASALEATDAGADAAEDAADADADVAAPPQPLPAFDTTPFPEEESKMPTAMEWDQAQDVSLSRGRSMAFATDPCRARRVREWMRIRCNISLASIALLGGDARHVFIRLDPLPEFESFPPGGEVIFQVRKGDRRVFEFLGLEWGYHGANSVTSFMVVSEAWLPSEEKPFLMAQ
jgi:hypothetical protein